MRPPGAPARAGRALEPDLGLRYLAPGAFTVLPPDGAPPPDPPPAPQPYRLTPTTRRHKQQSFAIIGEISSSPTSRSDSPSGRVSPFKGRGFNPAGSRHASPAPSPPPPENRRSPKHGPSKIPQYTRMDAATAFGEKVEPSKGNLDNRRLSQSLTNLQPGKPKKPPISPRKKTPAFQQLSPIVGSSPEPSQSLSSPSRIPKSRSTPPSRLVSPDRKDGNHPAGRPPLSKAPSRSVSRVASRAQSRNGSREVSPTRNPSTPTKSPVKNYKHVHAKVNSFNKPKPKVPPKPVLSTVLSETDSDVPNPSAKRPSLTRTDSVNKSSKISLLPKSINNANSDSSTSTDNINKNKTATPRIGTRGNVKPTTTPNKVPDNNNSSSLKTPSKTKQNGEHQTANKSNPKKNEKFNKTTVESGTSDSNMSRKNETTATTSESEVRPKLTKREDPSVDGINTTVVSSTTTTVTKPLKIDTKLDTTQYDKPKPVSPMVDGRVLSATSVSNALNKMNDTVLNTQTVIKDHAATKLSPAANAIIAVANEKKEKDKDTAPQKHKEKENSPTKTTSTPASVEKKPDNAVKHEMKNDVKSSNNITENKVAAPVGPPSQTVDNKMDANKTTSNIQDKKVMDSSSKLVNNHTNHVSNVGIGYSKALDMEVQKNFDKLISAGGATANSVQKSVNDRIREARTMIASDVKPIKITVREKPSDVEVQSGNIRFQSMANGLDDRPSLPPNQETPPNEPAKEEPPPNACKRFLTSCKNKLVCDCCKKLKKPKPERISEETVERRTSCFSCCKNKKQENQEVRINVEQDSPQKSKFFDRLKCCKRNRKVGDTTSCFSIGKRKGSWAERRESVLGARSQLPKKKCSCSKSCCKKFLATLFCLNLCLCCKKKRADESVSRKPSIISSKKKSLTPTTLPPPEDTKPKIDMSLVEHTSHMRGAIPVLPICLAWFCLVMNCIAPGTGTIFSGLFCLCLGIPRFSQKDGPKQRIGAFLIDLIIGFSQAFTILFCLVGWGWAIWWGVIMVKVARKHKKFKQMEAIEEANAASTAPSNHQNHRDLERGS